MKTLYISDLDGTLLDADARLSAYTEQTLTRLIGKGMAFTFGFRPHAGSGVENCGERSVKAPCHYDERRADL